LWAVLAVLSALGPLLVVSDAAAQLKLGGINLEGDIEAGVRLLPNEPPDQRKAKFEEYRDITEGPFLNLFRLRFFTDDDAYSAEVAGSKWGQDDQEFSLTAGRIGLWDFGFQWDQTPHVYSTTGRTLYREVAPGILQLDTPRPNLYDWDTARRIDEIKQRWDTGRVFFDVSPTPNLDLHLELTRIKKDGDKPFSMAFSSPGGNFAEFLAPIDETVTDIRLRATYAREKWQIQFGYTFSMFDNGIKSVSADNPCFGLGAAVAVGGCAGDATGAQPTGLISTAPDNMAHTVTIAGGVNLPLRTRLTANASYSLRLQNESFLGQTVNPAFTSPLLALPQESLDGMVGVALLNVNATSRPVSPLTLSLKYRLMDYNDMSDEPLFHAHVLNDRSFVVEERQALRYSYTKHNADADARIRIIQPLAFTLGAGWERWDRVSHREVPTTDEYIGKAAVDWTVNEWLTTKVTYRPSWRRIDEYNTFAHLAHTVVEDLGAADLAASQSTLLRKFDEADRDRQRVDLLLLFTPLDTVSTTFNVGWRKDDYLNSPLGLQDATEWTAGFDVTWSPTERMSFFGGYVREVIFQKQRSRSRPVTGTTTFDFPDFEWISVNTDTVDTFHVGTNIALLPKTLDLTFGVNYSTATGEVETRNPVAPTSTGAGAAAITSATAKRMPAFEDSLLRLDTALRYHFWKAWTASVGYAYESFGKHDWRTDTLNPFQPSAGSSIWLGNDVRNYGAHIVGLTLGYHIK
jgi:MtrB/PioB family decaheme-associated outer membrane protein